MNDSDDEMEKICRAPTLKLGDPVPEDSADVKQEQHQANAFDAILAANKAMMQQMEQMKVQNMLLEQRLIAATGAATPPMTGRPLVTTAQGATHPPAAKASSTSPETQRQLFSPPLFSTPLEDRIVTPPSTHGLRASIAVPPAPPALASESLPPASPSVSPTPPALVPSTSGLPPASPKVPPTLPQAPTVQAPTETPPAPVAPATELKDGEEEIAAAMDLDHEDASIACFINSFNLENLETNLLT